MTVQESFVNNFNEYEYSGRIGNRDELGLDKIKHVQHEIADVLIYLIRLADLLEIDLTRAVNEKVVINGLKYPVEKVRGDSRKYDEYDDE